MGCCLSSLLFWQHGAPVPTSAWPGDGGSDEAVYGDGASGVGSRFDPIGLCRTLGPSSATDSVSAEVQRVAVSGTENIELVVHIWNARNVECWRAVLVRGER